MNRLEKIEEIFNRVKNQNNYFRVSPEFRNDIYLGINSDGKMTMVVIGGTTDRKAVSTQKINLNYYVRTDGQGALEISLLDERFEKVFVKFCEDFITNSIDVDKSTIINHILTRWGIWRAMFKEARNELMSEERIKGLMGELLFLRHVLLPEGEFDAVESWQGCCGSEKDFVTRSGWYEIKAISLQGHSVKISSIEQLSYDEEGMAGYLVVCRFTKTNRENLKGININALVLEIATEIEDTRSLKLFEEKIVKTGYEYRSEYDEICFEYAHTEYYLVDFDFPTIRRTDLKDEIISAQYVISIAGLREWRIETWM